MEREEKRCDAVSVTDEKEDDCYEIDAVMLMHHDSHMSME